MTPIRKMRMLKMKKRSWLATHSTANSISSSLNNKILIHYLPNKYSSKNKLAISKGFNLLASLLSKNILIKKMAQTLTNASVACNRAAVIRQIQSSYTVIRTLIGAIPYMMKESVDMASLNLL